MLLKSFKSLLRDERGLSAIEYALICGLIVIVMVVGFNNFGNANRATWNTVSGEMNTAVTQSVAA